MKLTTTTIGLCLLASGALAQTTVQSCNRAVTFDTPPSAAISNDVNLTEMMLVLGLSDRMVGYTGISGWKTLDEEMRAGVEELPELSEKYPSKEVLIGADADFFYFPAYAEKDLGSPVLGAGTLWAITSDSPAAQALIEFRKSPIAHEVWMAQGGFLTAHAGVNTETYLEDSLKAQGDILLNATTFRFDASDLMPGEIGAGAFWTGMVDYTGGKDAAAVTKEIQESWEALK